MIINCTNKMQLTLLYILTFEANFGKTIEVMCY
jgi:hypothetical protein